LGKYGYTEDEIARIERKAIQAVQGEVPLADPQIEKELSDFFKSPEKVTLPKETPALSLKESSHRKNFLTYVKK